MIVNVNVNRRMNTRDGGFHTNGAAIMVVWLPWIRKKYVQSVTNAAHPVVHRYEMQIIRLQGLHHLTHEDEKFIHKGSQWALFMPTHVAARIYNGSGRVFPAESNLPKSSQLIKRFHHLGRGHNSRKHT